MWVLRKVPLLGMSLSARRAWIEIAMMSTLNGLICVALRKESVDRNDPDGIMVFCGPQSLSARRAWIEMEVTRNAHTGTYRRSPQGERG